jgi:hypothetical protein
MEVLYEGFLFKEGRKWKSWKKRFFRLYVNGSFIYYNDKKEEIGKINVLKSKFYKKKVKFK